MKTYLVPVDFSHASVHAAEFAAALSHQTDVIHIILLNAYYVSVYETILPDTDMVQLTEEQVEQNAAERLKKLNELKTMLQKKVRPGVQISTHLYRSHLLRAVVENAISENADLVVLGSIGNSSNDEAKIGSHVIKISKISPVPVLVVPPAYDFEVMRRVVVACDFNKVTEAEPLQALKSLLDRRGFELLAVNIGNKAGYKHNDAEQMAKETALYGMLQAYNPQYFFLNKPDVINGILQFATENDAQLVIALPHKYSFFQSLLHDSVSQKLAENSAMPVLLLK